jgi:hypothetical protein
MPGKYFREEGQNREGWQKKYFLCPNFMAFLDTISSPSTRDTRNNQFPGMLDLTVIFLPCPNMLQVPYRSPVKENFQE